MYKLWLYGKHLFRIGGHSAGDSFLMDTWGGLKIWGHGFTRYLKIALGQEKCSDLCKPREPVDRTIKAGKL